MSVRAYMMGSETGTEEEEHLKEPETGHLVGWTESPDDCVLQYVTQYICQEMRRGGSTVVCLTVM